MSDNESEQGTGQSAKPRRLEDDTLNYLTQLDVQLSADGLDRADQDILVENVLSEIKQRTASAACDRRTNYIIEKLCYAASLPNLMEIIKRITPYAVFLARNRHASHVLQAILARLCFILKNEGIGDADEDYLKQVVLEFVGAMLAEISWLAKDLNGSHVIRSCICALAGIPVISERKGKGSKHQHSVSLSEPLESLVAPGKFYINKKVCFGVPDDFHEALGESVASLLSLPVRDLQAMIADSSSSAVLGLILRIFFAPNVIFGGAELAERLARAAMEIPPEEGGVITPGKGKEGTVFYAMAGDRAGSYFLESVMECSNAELFIQLASGYLQGNVMDYATDGGGNFVLQAALRRLSAELERRDSDASSIASMEKCGTALIQELLADSGAFTSLALTKGGVVLWMLEVARWLPETQTTGSSSSSKSAKSWSEAVGTALLNIWTDNGMKSLGEVLAAKFTPREGKTTHGKANATFKGKGGDKSDAVGLERDSAQLLIARLTGALLRVSKSAFLPGEEIKKASEGESEGTEKKEGKQKSALAVSALVAKAIATLPTDVLKHLCTSGPLSRAVIDTFLDYCAGNASSVFSSSPSSSGSGGGGGGVDDLVDDFLGIDDGKKGGKGSLTQRELEHRSRDRSKFLLSFHPFVIDLAAHFSGQHVLRRAYTSATANEKEKIVAALDAAKDQLSHSKEGRNSLRNTNAELYARKPDEWRSLLKKQNRAKEMLLELEGKPSKSHGMGGDSSNSHSSTSKTIASASASASHRPPTKIDHQPVKGQEEDDDADGDDDGKGDGDGRRKRKRKRSGKNKTDSSAAAAAESEAAATKKPNTGANNADKPPPRPHTNGGTTNDSIPHKVPRHHENVNKPNRSNSAAPRPSESQAADMRLIEKLRSGKVTSIKKLGDELSSIKKSSK